MVHGIAKLAISGSLPLDAQATIDFTRNRPGFAELSQFDAADPSGPQEPQHLETAGASLAAGTRMTTLFVADWGGWYWAYLE